MNVRMNPVEFARLRRQMADELERMMWQLLRNRQRCNQKFRREHPLGIYTADFYCVRAKLVVEFDGEFHQTHQAKEYDSIRDQWMKDQGIRVLRFTCTQVEKETQEESSGNNRSLHPSYLAPIWRFFIGKPKQLQAFITSLQDVEGTLYRDMLLLELKLVAGEYKDAIELGDRLTRDHSRDLRLQDQRARAKLLSEFPSYVEEDLRNGYEPFRKMFCRDPFNKLTTSESGYATVCCTNWLNESIGSFYLNSYEEVWNSSVANDIRRSIVDGSFQYCNKTACPFIRNKSREIAAEGQDE